ncbi:MAG: polymer-forming cytoskeletal protein [Nitrospiria bacterium]
MAFGREESSTKGAEELIIFMGKGVELKGDIEFEGSGRLDGKVEGKIQVKGSLILGEGAVISSEIESGTVIVGGRVTGKILAHKKVALLKTAIVNCEIVTPSLVIEEGAQFNGTSRMGRREEDKVPVFTPALAEDSKQKPLIQAVK